MCRRVVRVYRLEKMASPVTATQYNNAAALASEIDIMFEDFRKASGGEPYLPKSKLKALLESQAPGVSISEEQAAAFAGDCDDKISFDEARLTAVSPFPEVILAFPPKPASFPHSITPYNAHWRSLQYVCAVHGVDWVEVISQDKEPDEDTANLSHKDRWGKIFDKAKKPRSRPSIVGQSWPN